MGIYLKLSPLVNFMIPVRKTWTAEKVGSSRTRDSYQTYFQDQKEPPRVEQSFKFRFMGLSGLRSARDKS